jgi:PIN like domain
LAEALGALYGHHGFEFLHLEKLVHGRTKDETWADAFKKFGGRIVISGDSKIAYKPHQAIAFIDNGFVSFFPEEDWCHLKGHQRSAVMVHAWPAMHQRIRESNFGTCWRVPCSVHGDELRLPKESDLQPLRIPDHVLEEARNRAKSA